MKRHILSFIIAAIFATTSVQGQPFLPDENALEGVIVEKYYESNTTDETVSMGALPAGTITYRVYADLKPGYAVSGVVGLTSPTVHPLSIRVTNNGSFYNSAFGGTFGTDLNPLIFAVDGLTALDSYITIGAATNEHFGVLKNGEEDGSSILAGSLTGVLQNEGSEMCLPALTEQDGLASASVPSINSVGIANEELSKLQTLTSPGPFEIVDGSWFNPESVMGTGEENHVLIGQFTTIGGNLEFDLNIVVLIPEELQCTATPACQKSSITFTATLAEGDAEYNEDPESNNVHYQSATCSYSDDGSACPEGLNISDVSLSENFSVYPNPTAGDLQVQLDLDVENLQYAVYDATGRLLMSSNVGSVRDQEVFSVNTDFLNNGVHFLQITSGDSVTTTKFVVKK